jgi:hypothetical protein
VYYPYALDTFVEPPDLPPAEVSGDEVIFESPEGIDYISPTIRDPGQKTLDSLDPEFKTLVDEVLSNP